MKTKESLDVFKKYYLKEFTFFDGENDITFNIVGIDFEKQLIEVAITNFGRISVIEYDLKKTKMVISTLSMVAHTKKLK